MQENPYFSAQLAFDSADGARLQKRILTEVPQI
jgi:hypothetical protein